MHVELAEQAKAAGDHGHWGEWALGDLLSAVASAVELVGPGARVVEASVRLPAGGLPLVTLHVEDDHVADGLWDAAVENEYDLVKLRQDERSWVADANGILLRVIVMEVGAP